MAQPIRTLFLVEDTEEDELLALRGIRRCGVPCDVKVIRHGVEALTTLLDAEGPTPDLVVLDFHLPGLNGLEILRELRRHERTRRVPVVLLSSLASDRQISECLDAGANGCATKPFDATQYEEQVALIVRYWFTVDQRPERHPNAL